MYNTMKRFWAYITHRKTDYHEISSIKQDGTLIIASHYS